MTKIRKVNNFAGEVSKQTHFDSIEKSSVKVANPAPILTYEVKRITKQETDDFYKKYHYIGKSLICPVHYGEFEHGKLTACASFGFLPSPLIPKSVWINGNNSNTYELRRLSSISKTPNAESHFISQCIKKLKIDYPNIKLIFSYADEKAGHHGYIYQASNFYYVGIRAGNTIYYFNNKGEKIHCRTVNRWKIKNNPKFKTINTKKQIKDTFRKHLYIYIIYKQDRKKILKELNPKCQILPYPKGDNKL